MKRKITPIVIASVLFGLLFDFFFYAKAPGISVLLYTIIILGTVIYFSNLFRNPLNSSIYLLIPIILFFAAFTFIRASGMLLFFNTFLIFYLLLLLVRLRQIPDTALTRFNIGQYFQSIPILPFRFYKEANTELRTLKFRRENASPRLTYGPVLRGLLISLPILIVFVLLLSSADLEFHKFVSSIFRFHISINGNLVAQLILAVLVALAFIGALVIFFMRPPEQDHEKVRPNRFELGTVESSIILGSIEALFLLFLLVQAAYFFGGSHQVMTTGFTYAEYARHGFFELITVAALSLLLIWWLKQSIRLHTPRQTNKFKILVTLLIAEVMIIMISAHSRLSLYENTYGFTESRILAHLFIYWLAVAFILLAIYTIRTEPEHQFAFRLFISVLVFFAVLNLINPDALIARHNVARMQATGKIDSLSLANLSEDATPILAQLLASNVADPLTHNKVSGIVSDELYNQQLVLTCRDTHWQSANIARRHAEDVLQANANLIAPSSENTLHCDNGNLRY
jgi:hypothetical protein